MKKFLACLCLLLVYTALSCALPQPSLAFRSKRIVRRQKVNSAERWEVLAKSLSGLAQRIATHNKFIYETKLSDSERTGDEIYTRIWAKDKTLVVGCESMSDEGRNYAYYINTSDPEIFFAGNIRAGADIGVIEKFFGTSVNYLSSQSQSGKKGEITLLPETGYGDCFRILYKDNKITELEWYFLDSARPSLERVAQVVGEKKSEMGLSSWEMLQSKY